MNPDFKDILSAFAEKSVEYLVVGAYALAAHGVPRATGDLDLWIRRSRDNAERALEALQDFGAPLHNLTAEELLDPDLVFQIGVEPRRIDILSAIEGVDFDRAWPNRLTVTIDDLEVPVIGRQALIDNKHAVGRARDLADIERLKGDD